MKITPVTDRITYVQPDSMTDFSSCAGLVVNSTRKFCIDLNLGPNETPGFLAAENPDAAIITHFHLDHSLCTRYVTTHTQATMLVPEKEVPCLTSLDFVVEHTAGPFGMTEAWKKFVVHLGYQPLSRYEPYSEKTVLAEFVPEMVLIATPGHSPGHTSFYFPDDKILFSGDLGLDKFGPWYGWQDCSIPHLVESILRLDGLDVGLILTSHGGILRKNIQPAWAASIRAMVTREETIRKKLDKGVSRGQIIQEGVFYSQKTKISEPMRSFLNMWDTAMFDHHANMIQAGGLLRLFPEISSMV